MVAMQNSACQHVYMSMRFERPITGIVTAGLAAFALAACGSTASKTLSHRTGHVEIEQFGANAFRDYKSASEVGPYLLKGAHVRVDCLAKGPIDAAPSANGEWYHIIGPKPYVNEYAAANTFDNGDTHGPLKSQPAVDPKVPLC